MNRKKSMLAAAIASVGVLGLASIGLAAAQTGDAPADPGTHSAMADHGQMGRHSGMSGMPGHSTERHAQMHEAAAKALGVTGAELDTQLQSGKSVAAIAAEKGIDLATLQASMEGAHPAGHGASMMGDGAGHECPATSTTSTT